MAIRLNHTIVAAHDKQSAAKFLSELLGLPAPSLVGPFAVVRVNDDTSLDYVDTDGEITSQHYAFLVDENEFDEIFGRIRARGLRYWADPGRREGGAGQYLGWRTWSLFRRSERPSSGDHHPSVRQRWHDHVPALPLVRMNSGVATLSLVVEEDRSFLHRGNNETTSNCSNVNRSIAALRSNR